MSSYISLLGTLAKCFANAYANSLLALSLSRLSIPKYMPTPLAGFPIGIRLSIAVVVACLSTGLSSILLISIARLSSRSLLLYNKGS